MLQRAQFEVLLHAKQVGLTEPCVMAFSKVEPKAQAMQLAAALQDVSATQDPLVKL